LNSWKEFLKRPAREEEEKKKFSAVHILLYGRRYHGNQEEWRKRNPLTANECGRSP
jgi:hypothetical protein